MTKLKNSKQTSIFRNAQSTKHKKLCEVGRVFNETKFYDRLLLMSFVILRRKEPGGGSQKSEIESRCKNEGKGRKRGRSSTELKISL